ncbi:hypothetical protein C5167_015099 [Papaver somniferum]|uniref:Uncharacterized protein n=1 Tax=Papaver somniferum TaxID=3469 RepID=A0A4Y7J529_PAPSO|nr:hypothetical protein C5167_015099 [Papaver somniferum]
MKLKPIPKQFLNPSTESGRSSRTLNILPEKHREPIGTISSENSEESLLIYPETIGGRFTASIKLSISYFGVATHRTTPNQVE